MDPKRGTGISIYNFHKMALGVLLGGRKNGNLFLRQTEIFTTATIKNCYQRSGWWAMASGLAVLGSEELSNHYGGKRPWHGSTGSPTLSSRHHSTNRKWLILHLHTFLPSCTTAGPKQGLHQSQTEASDTWVNCSSFKDDRLGGLWDWWQAA